jgi:hypothetical protein
MIQKEFYLTREDGVMLYRTYSDANFYIRKTGTDEVYTEAIDVEGAPYEYEETEEVIEKVQEVEQNDTNCEIQ